MPADEESLPDDVRKDIRLSGIFMPVAREERNRLFAGPATSKFVHYTRASAALNIIREKRIWLRSTMAMTDYSEVIHGQGLLRNFFSVEKNKADFMSAMDAVHPGAALSAVALFDIWWNHPELGIPSKSAFEKGVPKAKSA